MGSTNFPGSPDNFATTSPTNLGDEDSTGRIHTERHDDMESAMEAVQSFLLSITFNDQTGTSYTLALSDNCKLVTLNNASAISLTVPTNATVAFPVGSRVMLAQLGAGQVTIGGAGVTLRSTPGLKIAAQYGVAEVIKIATDEWLVIGRLAA